MRRAHSACTRYLYIVPVYLNAPIGIIYTHTTTAVYAVHIKPHTTVAADAAARHAHSDHVSRYGTVIIVASARRPRQRGERIYATFDLCRIDCYVNK